MMIEKMTSILQLLQNTVVAVHIRASATAIRVVLVLLYKPFGSHFSIRFVVVFDDILFVAFSVLPPCCFCC